MSKFKVWIDSPNIGTNIQSAATFDSDTQRTRGFVGGTSASAIRTNTALRQANLVVAALMNLVNNNNLSVESSVSDVQSALNTYFTGLNVARSTNASNVTTNINGKAITNIFESNGTTAKNATNVTTNINGKAISSIFESNGTTVKKATNATNASVTTDSTVGSNVVKFQIGNGTEYNKTINDVANATTVNNVSVIKNASTNVLHMVNSDECVPRIKKVYDSGAGVELSGTADHISSSTTLNTNLSFKLNSSRDYAIYGKLTTSGNNMTTVTSYFKLEFFHNLYYKVSSKTRGRTSAFLFNNGGNGIVEYLDSYIQYSSDAESSFYVYVRGSAFQGVSISNISRTLTVYRVEEIIKD